MNDVVDHIRRELGENADPIRAEHSLGYFKSEHTKNDIFLGVKVPIQRSIVKKYFDKLEPREVLELLRSEVHEERLTALLIWVSQYKKADIHTKNDIYNLYLKNTKWIDNWDLVDSSASYIVGAWVFDKDRSILEELSKSKNVWERRIALLATFYFIQFGDFDWSIKLAEQLIDDEHHYIHKASGWMMREIGKRDYDVLINFLDQHATRMPRTMLRYAIEKLSEDKRKHYLLLK